MADQTPASRNASHAAEAAATATSANSSGSDDDQQQEESYSYLRCPVDVSCLWRVPTFAFQKWVSWSAAVVGLNPDNVNIVTDPLPRGGRCGPRYVRLHGTSSESVDDDDGVHHDHGDDDDEEHQNHGNEKRPLLSGGAAGAKKPRGKKPLLAADGEASSSGTLFGSHLMNSSPMIKVSGEFEVWQKYLRDLSNFSAVDVDASIVPSSTASDAVPLLVLTIRGPVVPSLGRCRRSLDGTAFIPPSTLDEWLEANPVRVMEVVEAFLLAVLSPAELVADDDTIQSIIETGTHILAMPAPDLNPFLAAVAAFVQSNRIATKVVIRDIDFTAEFDSARPQLAGRFMVLDTSNPSAPKAREPSTSGNGFLASSILFRGGGGGGSSSTLDAGGGDHGSCPEVARNNFEADYSMLDVVRAVRSFTKRVIGGVANLRAVEVHGCMMRDSDMDVSGFLGGRISAFEVVMPASSHHKGNNNGNGDDDDEDDGGGSSEFQSRPGHVQAEPKRLHGPVRLSIEHCGLADNHLSALIRLIRLESERVKRGHFSGSNADTIVLGKLSSSHHQLLLCSSMAAFDSLRLSGQFYPTSVVGLVTAMHEAWEQSRATWARKAAGDPDHDMSASEGDVRFPLRELDVPSSALHIVRSALESRGLSSMVHVRSSD